MSLSGYGTQTGFPVENHLGSDTDVVVSPQSTTDDKSSGETETSFDVEDIEQELGSDSDIDLDPFVESDSSDNGQTLPEPPCTFE